MFPLPRTFVRSLAGLLGAATASHALTPLDAPLAAGKPPYLDTKLPFAERVADLVPRLSLEEKAAILNHKHATLPRVGLRGDQWNQCLNGVKWDRPSTLFPTCIAMSATWNPALVGKTAAALSDEARAIYHGWRRDPQMPGEHKGLIYRAPVINISRNPNWGRIHEVFGEDPFLTGEFAVAYVNGLQGTDPRHLKIAATLKHFAVNNVETDRQKLDAQVPERVLREYWLPHWHRAVTEAKACSLMASYNAINGTPNNINRSLLTDLLKKEWGHEGFVVSDLGGVRTMVEGHMGKKMSFEDAVAQSVMAGCDFSDAEYERHIPGAVKAGKLDMARLDDAVRRVLLVRMRLGEFDPPESLPWSKLSLDIIDGKEHRVLAREVARQSLVLLENRDSFLPLDPGKGKRLAVIGPLADRVILNNYNGAVRDAVSPLAGIRARFADTCEVTHTLGSEVGGQPHPWVKEAKRPPLDTAAELAKAVALAKEADTVILCVGTDASVEHEGRDRKSLGLTDPQDTLARAVIAANPRTVVVLMSAGPLIVPWIKDNAAAVIQAWWPGGQGGHALADVLSGDHNPSGKLPYTVYASEEQIPPRDEYDVSKGFTYQFLKGEPLWAFGHGLGYSRFDCSDLRISPAPLSPDQAATVTLTVKNSGQRPGAEVVQLYSHSRRTSLVRPTKQLRAFRRVELAPGATAEVTFPLPAAQLSFWDDASRSFRIDPGTHNILVGRSSADILLRGTVECKGQ